MLIDTLTKLIIFFLPTQLGLHFWPAFSRAAGIRIDYLSPTLYFLDILLFIYITLSFKLIFKYLKKNYKSITIPAVLIILNTIFAISPLNTLLWWSRTILYISVFFAFRLNHLSWNKIKNPLLYSTILIVLLELFQLINQSSIGGPFYFLGERAFTFSTPGLARLNLLGREILRPMSVFSHPNSLAGYLLIVFYIMSLKSKKTWHKIIPFLGILLTLSKTSIVTLALLIINVKPGILFQLSLFVTIIQPILVIFPIIYQSLSDRLFFYPYFHKIMKNNSLTGVGLGNFIPALGKILPGSYITPAKLQPIHNIYALFISELGLIGIIALISTVTKNTYKKIVLNPEVLGLISIVLFIGAFDHYSWTLPQNKLILLISLAILF